MWLSSCATHPTWEALIAAPGQHMPRSLVEATEGVLRRGGVATAHQDVGETINALEEQGGRFGFVVKWLRN